MKPRLNCAITCPCSAASVHHRTASGPFGRDAVAAGVHASQIVLGVGVPLFRRVSIPADGMGIVLRHAAPFAVVEAEVELRRRVTLLGRRPGTTAPPPHRSEARRRRAGTRIRARPAPPLSPCRACACKSTSSAGSSGDGASPIAEVAATTIATRATRRIRKIEHPRPPRTRCTSTRIWPILPRSDPSAAPSGRCRRPGVRPGSESIATANCRSIAARVLFSASSVVEHHATPIRRSRATPRERSGRPTARERSHTDACDPVPDRDSVRVDRSGTTDGPGKPTTLPTPRNSRCSRPGPCRSTRTRARGSRWTSARTARPSSSTCWATCTPSRSPAATLHR